MARETITKLVDDLDGSEAHNTVLFGLDGQAWSIDLNSRHENELRAKLDPFLGSARRVRQPARAGTSSRSADKDRNLAIREWAASEGVVLNARGRIANAVLAAYDAQDGDALRDALGLVLVPEKPRRGRRAAEFSEAR